jgi:hypothetical protein
VDEATELVSARDKIGLASSPREQHADLSARMNVGIDDSFCGDAGWTSGSGRQPSLAQHVR